MKTDPTLCSHANIKKSVKIDTISVPELGIEQLVIRVKAYCGDCKEAFIPKTLTESFSTGEIGVLDNEVIVPLAYPQEMAEEVHVEEIEQNEVPLQNRDKNFLH